MSSRQFTSSVSIIIPFAKPYPITFQCIEACFKQHFETFEIIVLPDGDPDEVLSSRMKSLGAENGIRYTIMPTGRLYPSAKRNIGIGISRSDILVFIDDDAVPEPAWLSIGVELMKYPEVGAVGGPITPLSSAHKSEHAADFIIKSGLGLGGAYNYRKKKVGLDGKDFELVLCDAVASCNLFVRRDVLLSVGKFDGSLEFAEDIDLCEKIREKQKLIIFLPELKVAHRVRPLFLSQAKRVFALSQKRPRYLKPFRIYFVIPSIFVLWILLGFIASFFSRGFRFWYIASLICYSFFILTHARKANIRIMPLVFLGALVLHIAYGLGFMRGLFRIKDEG